MLRKLSETYYLLINIQNSYPYVKEEIKDVISPKAEDAIQKSENTNPENQLVVTEKNEEVEDNSDTSKKEKLQPRITAKEQRKQNLLLRVNSEYREYHCFYDNYSIRLVYLLSLVFTILCLLDFIYSIKS